MKRDFITDKKLIKNGMYFSIGDKYYIKIGKICVGFNPTNENNLPFDEISQEEIKYIFKPNGIALVKEEGEKENEF